MAKHGGLSLTKVDNMKSTIIDLIEKQQKEIKELKNNELDHTTIYIHGKLDGEKKYKDKIREKIKEIQNYTLMSEQEIAHQDYAIERLKELLEE